MKNEQSSYPLPCPLSSGEGYRCRSTGPAASLTGEAAPPTPLGLKALSDFRSAKVPGTAGRLMTAY